MADARPASLPSVEEALAWKGSRIDEMGGSSVGRVQGIYVDAESGEPVWLAAKTGRFGRTTAVLIRDCAAAAGHVWTAHPRDAIRRAPAIDPRRPLTREAELELCAHYGIGEGQSRQAEVADRPEGSVTAEPAEA